jgi:putative hydrolase of the HAD superfamily
MITTVIFDLDDTLYDEIDYCRSGFSAVADFLADRPGYPPAGRIFETLWKEFSSGNHKTTFNAALEQLGIQYDVALIKQLVEVYRNHSPSIKLPQESKDVLRRLSRKYTLALLTDGFLPAQQLKVRALAIEKYFKSIIYTELLGRNCWKPSPVGFEKLLQTLNAKPQNSAFLGNDEKKDFIAPNKLGLSTIRIIRLYSEPVEPTAGIHTEPADQPHAAAKYTIRSLSDLPPLLEKL